MARGELEQLTKDSTYIESTKRWHVELARVDRIWYDLIINPHEEIDTKKVLSDQMKELSNDVKMQLDKRFIYFIASRKKIRFSTIKKPRYSRLNSKLIFYIEIGSERKLKKLSLYLVNPTTGKVGKPEISITDRFINISDGNGNWQAHSVHDFIADAGFDLNISSKIYYVGYTKNPWKRPIDGNHRGLSETLYRIDSNDFDVFIFYNLFKVLSIAKENSRNIDYVVANSMIDEIKVDDEGSILEKCLICYFQAESQIKNHESEKKELENSLVKLAEANNIKSISFDYELENHNEYFRFYSDAVPANHQHTFTCSIDEGILKFTKDREF